MSKIYITAFTVILLISSISRAQYRSNVPESGFNASGALLADSDNFPDSLKFQTGPGINEPYVRNTLNRATLKNLPIRDFNQYLRLFPSTWQQDSRLHIRAGRSDETGYLVNGLSISDPLDNSFAGYLIPEAIDEISMMPGTYSARYGLANSGLIMTKMRSGSSNLKFSLDVHSDKFAGEGEKYLNTYSYQDRYIVAQGEGPLYWDKLRFYTALEFSDIGDAAKRFSQAFYFPDLIDGNPSSYAVYTGNPDTLDLIYPDGYTPDNSQSRWALNTKFDLDLDPVHLEFLTLYDEMDAYDSNIPMIDVLNSRKFFTRSHRILIQGGLRHQLSSNSVYKINAAYFSSESESYDDITGNNWLAWSDTALVSQLTGGRIDFNANSSLRYPRYRFNGLDFYQNGAITSDYYHTNNKYFSFTASIDHQLDRMQRLYAGIDYRSYKLRYYQVNPVAGYTLRVLSNREDEWFNPESYIQEYVDNLYGFDVFGRETDSGPDPAREPNFFAVYLEDRIKTEKALFSFGLRLDRFFTDDRIMRYPANPGIHYNDRTIPQSEWQVQDAQWYLSPRIGIVVNTGGSTIIRANYNRLVQPPPLKNSYYANFIYARQIGGGYFYSYPIGFDLTAIQSRLIDFSLSHQFSRFVNISAAMFYKRTAGQVQVDRQNTDSTSSVDTYYRMTSQGKSEISGLDLQLQLNRTRRTQLFFNYTYTYARGTGSNETSNYTALYRYYWENMEKYDVKALYPLDFVPVHTILMDIDYRFADNDGGPILQNLGMNILLTTDSGHPYTASWVPRGGSVSFYNLGTDYIIDPRSREAIEPQNSSKTPWRFNVDLRIDKNIHLGKGFSLLLYLRVLNLFNTRQVENVYPYSGTAETDGMINDPNRTKYMIMYYGEKGRDIYNALNTTNGQSYWDLTGNELYLHPRQIFLGIRLNY